MSLRLYYNPSGLEHDTGPNHPECPARLAALLALFSQPPFKKLKQIKAKKAKLKWIAYAHDKAYIEKVKNAIPTEGLANIDGDTCVSPGSWSAALDAAGAVCRAARDVMKGKTDTAFCAVRPPGHHAEPDKAMGFCLFSNAAIGGLYAVRHCKAKRVAIIDFDVHHGNGTNVIAMDHDELFYASSHQAPLFPGSGFKDDSVNGRIINVPLPAGSGTETFRKAYEERIFPPLEAFKPDLIIISAGFDAHEGDPLAGMKLDEDDFIWFTEKLMDIAGRVCDGRIVSVLEGGYNIDALTECAAAHIRTLAEL